MLTPKFMLKDTRRFFEHLDGGPLAYLVALGVLIFVAAFGAHFWLANDDIHMAMIAHGYGFTDTPSPGLVYSNVIWGWLVMHLGTVFGLQGYAVGSYLLMAASCAALVYAFRTAGVVATLAATLLLCMLANSSLEMQFTIVAGYLATAGFALALTAGTGSPWRWIAAAAFLFAASLIRLEESLFVWIVAAPFCVSRFLATGDRRLRLRWVMTLSAAAVCIGLGFAANRAYYSGAEWQQFNQINKLRRPFTDYNLDGYYAQHPEALTGSKLSMHDVQMLGAWFYADTDVFNEASLTPLVKNVSFTERARFNLSRYGNSLRIFRNQQIAILFVLFVFLLAICRERKPALAAILLLLGVTLAFLLLGRPGVERIYPPVAAGLAIFTLLTGAPRRHPLISVVALVLLLAGIGWSFGIYHSHLKSQAKAEHASQAICSRLGDDLQVVWGTRTGLRYLYRPFSPRGGCELKLYTLGVLQLLPSNLAALHRYTGGKDLVQALLAHQSLHFLTDEARLQALDQFLYEHYRVHLHYVRTISIRGLQQFLVQVPD